MMRRRILWYDQLIMIRANSKDVDAVREVIIELTEDKALSREDKFAGLEKMRDDRLISYATYRTNKDGELVKQEVAYSIHACNPLSVKEVYELALFIRKSPAISKESKDILFTYLADRDKLTKGNNRLSDSDSIF